MMLRLRLFSYLGCHCKSEFIHSKLVCSNEEGSSYLLRGIYPLSFCSCYCSTRMACIGSDTRSYSQPFSRVETHHGNGRLLCISVRDLEYPFQLSMGRYIHCCVYCLLLPIRCQMHVIPVPLVNQMGMSRHYWLKKHISASTTLFTLPSGTVVYPLSLLLALPLLRYFKVRQQCALARWT